MAFLGSFLKSRRVLPVIGTLVLVTALLIPQIARSSPVYKTWTTDADFDEGTLQSVNHDAPNNDQLQISTTISTFPIMWVANSGESTVSKINTDTGKEVARYRTWHWANTGWSGPAPSRTTVDSDGNAYVLNRMFGNTGKSAYVVKILATGGIDRNGNGTIETSSDLDSNGAISGAELLPLSDTNGNGIIEYAEIVDERVAWAMPVGGVGQIGRALTTGTDGNLWIGTFNDSNWYKMSSNDGTILGGPYSMPTGSQPYGAVVDSNGILWSASISSYLGKLDTNTGIGTRISRPGGTDYGIAIGNGKVYQAIYSGGLTYAEFDPSTSVWSFPAYNYPDTTYRVRDNIIAVAVASNGDIIATRHSGGVYRFAPDGKKLWYSAPQPGTGEARGAIIDSNGDVWVNHLSQNNISKFRGSDGAHLGVFPVGSFPYTYSDATGISALTNTTPTGYWTVVYEKAANALWDAISWNTDTPADTTVEVRVRTASTQAALDFQTYSLVSSGADLSSLTGEFMQIQVKFSSSQAGSTPVLHDLTLSTRPANDPPTANAGGPYTVAEGGSVILNGSGADPDGDPLTYAWDLDNDGTFETVGQNPTFSAASKDGPSSQTVVLQVTDDKGATATSTTVVNITNVAPVITGVSGATLVVLGSPVDLTGTFTDAGTPDTHTASFNWGDTTSSAGTITETNGSGTLNSAHTYAVPQFYTVTITLTDDDGGTTQTTVNVIVTASGEMTGGGRVDTGDTVTKGKNKQAVHTTHGFTLGVASDLTLSGNLQYNDHRNGDTFHASAFTSIIFIDDPALDPGNPGTKFDTAIVKGVGTLNKVEGVRFEAVITDNGEPGKTDTFKITFPDGQSAGISGPLVVGNHQAH